MRKLGLKQLSQLQQLTRLKRAILNAELAKMRARLASKEDQIASLGKTDAVATSFDAQRAQERWNRWAIEEKRRLNGERAVLRLEHDSFAKTVGEAVAEDAVVAKLIVRTKNQEEKEARRILEQNSSHFLSNNVGDQDV